MGKIVKDFEVTKEKRIEKGIDDTKVNKKKYKEESKTLTR